LGADRSIFFTEEGEAMPQKHEEIRPEMIVRIQLRLVVMLLGVLILVLLKRYGVL
jgi:hypothetical protein